MPLSCPTTLRCPGRLTVQAEVLGTSVVRSTPRSASTSPLDSWHRCASEVRKHPEQLFKIDHFRATFVKRLAVRVRHWSMCEFEDPFHVEHHYWAVGVVYECVRRLVPIIFISLIALTPSIKETCADIDRETVVSSLLGSLSKAKRDRDQNVVQILRDRQSLHKILERKA